MSTFDHALLDTSISDVGQCGPKRTQLWNAVGVRTIRDFLSFEGTPPPTSAYDTLLKNIISMIGADTANEILSKRKQTHTSISNQPSLVKPKNNIQTIHHNWYNKRVHVSTDGIIIRVGTVKELALTRYAGILVVVSLRIDKKPVLLVFSPQYLLCMYNNWLMITIVSDDEIDDEVEEKNSISDLRFYLPPLRINEDIEEIDANSISIIENETNLIVDTVLMHHPKYIELTNKFKHTHSK
jgi:hypothetical protein